MSEANTTTDAAAEIKFRPELEELKEKYRPHVVADAKAGTLSIPLGVVFQNAPEGMTEATYERDRKFLDLTNNALTLLGAEKSVELMKENKDLQQVTMQVPIWKKDSYEGVFKRQGQSRNVRTGEVSNYVGAVGVGRINVVSTRTQTEMANIKSYMRQMAEAADL